MNKKNKKKKREIISFFSRLWIFQQWIIIFLFAQVKKYKKKDGSSQFLRSILEVMVNFSVCLMRFLLTEVSTVGFLPEAIGNPNSIYLLIFYKHFCWRWNENGRFGWLTEICFHNGVALKIVCFRSMLGYYFWGFRLNDYHLHVSAGHRIFFLNK